MKNFFSIIAVAIAMAFAFSSCEKEPEIDPTKPTAESLVGDWQLTSVTTRSVNFNGTTIDVYISFASDGSFALYQMIGQGRFRKFTGKWNLTEDTLSGSYSSGKAWGSSYTVVKGDNKITLTAGSGEVDEYTKTTIPSAVISEAHEN